MARTITIDLLKRVDILINELDSGEKELCLSVTCYIFYCEMVSG